MKLPTKIKVANSVYTVEEKDGDWGKYTGYRGLQSTMLLKIEIDTSMQPSLIYESFIHEILHCIYDAYKLEDGDNEERTVCTLAGGLAQVFTDNPDLVKYLSDAPHETNT